MISIQNIHKRFGKPGSFELSIPSLEVQEGEILGILGPSGSGKSTLLRLISGIDFPDAGEIAIGSKVVCSQEQVVPIEERGIGMVFQNYALFPHLNVEENVAFGIKAKDRQQQLATEQLRLVGLEGMEKRQVQQISGGQQQRVALARALAVEPTLLLLDEPFSNLDENLKADLRTDLKAIISEKKLTTLIVAHDSRDLMAIADRILVLDGGRILAVDTPTELYRNFKKKEVGKMLGDLNVVSAEVFGEKSNEKICFRPEEVLFEEGNYQAEMNSIAFKGSHYVVSLSWKGQIIKGISRNSYNQGELINFDIPKEKRRVCS